MSVNYDHSQQTRRFQNMPPLTSLHFIFSFFHSTSLLPNTHIPSIGLQLFLLEKAFLHTHLQIHFLQYTNLLGLIRVSGSLPEVKPINNSK